MDDINGSSFSYSSFTPINSSKEQLPALADDDDTISGTSSARPENRTAMPRDPSIENGMQSSEDTNSARPQEAGDSPDVEQSQESSADGVTHREGEAGPAGNVTLTRLRDAGEPHRPELLKLAPELRDLIWDAVLNESRILAVKRCEFYREQLAPPLATNFYDYKLRANRLGMFYPWIHGPLLVPVANNYAVLRRTCRDSRERVQEHQKGLYGRGPISVPRQNSNIYAGPHHETLWFLGKRDREEGTPYGHPDIYLRVILRTLIPSWISKLAISFRQWIEEINLGLAGFMYSLQLLKIRELIVVFGSVHAASTEDVSFIVPRRSFADFGPDQYILETKGRHQNVQNWSWNDTDRGFMDDISHKKSRITQLSALPLAGLSTQQMIQAGIATREELTEDESLRDPSGWTVTGVRCVEAVTLSRLQNRYRPWLI